MWIVVYLPLRVGGEIFVIAFQDVVRMLWENGERLSIRTKGDGAIEVDLKRDVVELVKSEYELKVIVEKFLREGKIS